MIFYRNILGFVVALFLAMILGCSDPGPAEEAGEEIDETMEDLGEAVDPEGPAERAGRKIDETMEDLDEALESESED
ncbi:hypothetical protein [Desulfonatronospira sp.]|uniref:hypothetical protein n=1 Tax=Desulfonatronospira sp. TaxID=1962951 RepID=UPI0025C0869F|nr:hypothetical protein [Desulfonatronospira sp.]